MQRRRLKNILFAAIERFKVSDNTFLLSLAVLVGLVTGLGAVLFIYLIRGLQWCFYAAWTTETLDAHFGSWGHDMTRVVLGCPGWLRLLIPVVIAVPVGYMVYKWASEARGHGVPEVMDSVARKGGKIRPRVAIVKIISSALTISSGGSAGREGPIVQIGAAFGSTIGQFLNVSSERLRTLVGCGAAAGIAATFNAPIAGFFFASEIILGDFTVSTISPIAVSSIMAAVVSRYFLGNHPAFEIPGYDLVNPMELGFYCILGALCGLAALAFIKGMASCEEYFERKNLPDMLTAPVGGLVVGLIAFFGYAHVMGGGFDTISEVLNGAGVWHFLLLLTVLKMAATIMTLGAGGSGGIFAPSLFMGAMIGGLFGGIIHSLFPTITATGGAYALVGMGGVVAAATHAPLTAILIIFELTDQYSIILPLALTCILSTVIVRHFELESIYTSKLVKRGIRLYTGRDDSLMRKIMVADVMRSEVPLIPQNMRLPQLLDNVLLRRENYFYVVNGEQRLIGGFSLNDVKTLFLESSEADDLIIAYDVVRDNPPVITPEDTLAEAMIRLGHQDYESMPVVADKESGKVVGCLTRRDVMTAYNRSVLRESTANVKFIRESKEEKETDYVELPSDHRVKAVPVPSFLVGKSLREADIRYKWSLNVIAVKHQEVKTGSDGEPIVVYRYNDVPDPNAALKKEDLLILVGRQDRIEKFEAS